MIELTVEGEFDASVDKIWSIITNNENYAWRTDLKKVDIIDHSRFMEFNNKGMCSTITVTKKDENTLYGLDITNKDLNGALLYTFTAINANKCRVRFEEKLTFNKGFAQLIAKISGAPKKMREQYILDLKKTL